MMPTATMTTPTADPHLPSLGEPTHPGSRHRDRHHGRWPTQAEDRRVSDRPHAQDVAQHEGRDGRERSQGDGERGGEGHPQPEVGRAAGEAVMT